MDPEQLQQHLLLKNRARMIPDKKKQHDRRACRNTRQAFRPSTGSLLRQRGISAHDSAGRRRRRNLRTRPGRYGSHISHIS
jgi:hypothetical protein